jgi:PleD family two-component response regulator
MENIFLLIDDDADDSELFREALQEADATMCLHCAENGEEALKLLEAIEKPVIIFLDINMPRMNGWECLKRLKNSTKYKDIPVIMYSTSSHQREIDIAIDLGALSFFTKPHSYRELKIMLNGVIEKMKANDLNSLQLNASNSKTT